MTATGAATAGVVFDMDGVLVDSGAHHRAAWLALLEELAVTPPAEFWRLTIGRPADEAVALLLGSELDQWDAWRLAQRKREHYVRLARRGVLPVAGVTAFVKDLGRAGVPRAVATSASGADVDRNLDALGLRGQFAVVVTADDVRRGKPDPEVFLRAADGLGLPPGECLVFEDSVVGVQAAREAGMRVIGVATAHSAAELGAAGAERSVTDFEGLTWPV